MNVTCVLLAAGLSRRYGGNKLLERGADGRMLFERPLQACGAYPVLAVALAAVGIELHDAGVPVVLSDNPDRGMSYSLKCANARIDPEHAIAVVPADLALLDAAELDALIAALGNADLVYPRRSDGCAGDPMLLSPRARRFIDDLHDGDTIADLRELPELQTLAVPSDAPGYYTGVDTPADLLRLA
jgi:molybdenum cofactor cytidylyltransferase